jgi:hypothetical protein
MTDAGLSKRTIVAAARLHESVGWPGIVGAVLAAGSMAVATSAWLAHRGAATRPEAPVARAQLAMRAKPLVAATAVPELPSAAEIPLLLTLMDQAATSHHLDWHAADYRRVAATPSQPASLEVRFGAKAPYPDLRAMLVQMKTEIPGFTLREFSASRPGSDTPDVDAKLVDAVLLKYGELASQATVDEASTQGAP